MPSFDNKKRLRTVITLATGNFGNAQDNVVVLEGYRTSFESTAAGQLQMGSARIRIFGVTQQIMDAASVIAFQNVDTRLGVNVKVYAIDGDQDTLVFNGSVTMAWGDYSNMPDVCLNIQAQSALVAAQRTAKPKSFKGAVDVASVFGVLAREGGYILENNGVQTKLYDVYLASSLLEQIRDLAKQSRIDFGIEDSILWIAPKNAGRNGFVPLISKDTGMAGYPMFNGVGVVFKTLYNPAIRAGGRIKVETDINRANGEWVVASIAHNLSSEMPNGPWFSTVVANKSGLAIIANN